MFAIAPSLPLLFLDFVRIADTLRFIPYPCARTFAPNIANTIRAVIHIDTAMANYSGEENADVNMAADDNDNTNDVKPSLAEAAAAGAIPSRSVVHYKSSALDEIGMLKNRPISEVMNCPGVLAASEAAEKVRAEFKRKEKQKREEKELPVVEGEIGKAERYDRRTKLNRQSAAASRIRKEAYIKALEQQLLLHDDKYKELERSLVEEQTAHSKLKQDVQTAASMVSVKEEQLEIEAAPQAPIPVLEAPAVNNFPDAAILEQIFTNPNPPVPSIESSLNLAPIGSPSHELNADIFAGFNLPFEPIPQSYLENTSPFYPELNIDEMLK